MAMTAWSAKVFSSLICFSANSVSSARRSWIMPIATPSRMSGTLSVAPVADLPGAAGALRKLVGLGLRSRTCTARRSSTARPPHGPRTTGTMKPAELRIGP